MKTKTIQIRIADNLLARYEKALKNEGLTKTIHLTSAIHEFVKENETNQNEEEIRMKKLNGLSFETDLGHGEIEYIINVNGNQITVDTLSKLGHKCVFNEEYEYFTLEQFVNDLHEQQLEELSDFVWGSFGE